MLGRVGLATIWSVSPTKDKRKTAWARIFFVAVCVVSVLASFFMLRLQPPRATQSVHVLTSDWDPYVDTTVDKGGIVGDMVLSVLGASGYKGDVSFDTWENGLQKVDQGTAFGIFPMVKSASREEKFEFSDPLVDFTYVLFTQSDTVVDGAVLAGDLHGKRVGRISGYDYWPELDASGADFETYPSTVAGFDALSNGDIDFLAESDLVGNATLRSEKFLGDVNDFKQVHGDNPALSSNDSVYFLLHKSDLSRSVMERFNQALQQYKSTERYREQVAMLKGAPDHVALAGDSPVEVKGRAAESLGMVPAGVSARVLEWPSELDPENLLKIKMVDGPLAGQIGYVRLEDVEVLGVQG